MKFRLFAAALALSFASAAWPEDPGELAVRAMSFNIRYGTAEDGDNHWDLRKDLVVDTVRAYDPDIVGMQEALDFQAVFITESLGEYGRFGRGRNRDGSGERMEILYRLETLSPTEMGHFWLSETPDVPGSLSWRSANIRMATWIRFYHLPTRSYFYHVNTHFDHRSEAARAGAAALLSDWIRALPRDEPVVLTGDFNARAESSAPWMTLTRRVLDDAWLIASDRHGPAVTWSGFAAPELSSDRRIDWILVGRGWKVLSAETVTYSADGRYPSDHFPVLADLRKSP